jgi:ERF superfamily
MKELLTALVAAKTTFKPIPKDKVNPFHKSKYASLDAVLGAVEPSLLTNGLTLSHTVDSGRLITRLYHTSGDFLESSFSLPELSDPQKLGSIISYYRRYAVCGLLSVTADEDDDGNAAKPSSANQAAYTKPSTAPIKVDPAIEASRQATRECFAILGWEKDRVLEWSAKINPAPFDSWTLENWRSANTKALMEIDSLNS